MKKLMATTSMLILVACGQSEVSEVSSIEAKGTIFGLVIENNRPYVSEACTANSDNCTGGIRKIGFDLVKGFHHLKSDLSALKYSFNQESTKLKKSDPKAIDLLAKIGATGSELAALDVKLAGYNTQRIDEGKDLDSNKASLKQCDQQIALIKQKLAQMPQNDILLEQLQGYQDLKSAVELKINTSIDTIARIDEKIKTISSDRQVIITKRDQQTTDYETLLAAIVVNSPLLQELQMKIDDLTDQLAAVDSVDLKQLLQDQIIYQGNTSGKIQKIHTALSTFFNRIFQYATSLKLSHVFVKNWYYKSEGEFKERKVIETNPATISHLNERVPFVTFTGDKVILSPWGSGYYLWKKVPGSYSIDLLLDTVEANGVFKIPLYIKIDSKLENQNQIVQNLLLEVSKK